MKILYDYQAFEKIYEGVSRYYCEIVKHLNPKIEREIAIKYSRNSWIKDILPYVIYPFGKLYVPFKRRLVRKLNHYEYISKLKNSKCDLFHATFDDSYFLPFVKTPFIITVHDLIPESEKVPWCENCLKSRSQVFSKGEHIITVSQKYKKRFTNLLPFFG